MSAFHIIFVHFAPKIIKVGENLMKP